VYVVVWIIRCSSRCSVSEEHLMAPSMSVCLSLKKQATHMTGGHCCAAVGIHSYWYSCWHFCSYYCYSMALSLPGWTPLCFYRLRLDHPGLRRTGNATEGLRQPLGLCHPCPSPRCLLPWGLAPCASRFWCSAPRVSILCLAHQGFGTPYSALAVRRPW
jgi:hypothetical protein